MTTDAPAALDYDEIAHLIAEGGIVPFFGAGASASCGLPSGSKLTQLLSKASSFPEERRRIEDLSLVASYFEQKKQTSALYREVRSALSTTASPGRLHKLLARQDNLRLYVTTNYDNLIEAAMTDAQRSPCVVVDCKNPEKVWQRRDPRAEWVEVESETLDIAKGEPVVLKLHGGFDPDDSDHCRYIITEEDYVGFLGRPKGGFAPAKLLNRMKTKSFLFLGYGLKDWNVRVLLRMLAEQRPPGDKVVSWAIVRDAKGPEQEIWERHDVKVCNVDLDDFAANLEPALEALRKNSPR